MKKKRKKGVKNEWEKINPFLITAEIIPDFDSGLSLYVFFLAVICSSIVFQFSKNENVFSGRALHFKNRTSPY